MGMGHHHSHGNLHAHEGMLAEGIAGRLRWIALALAVVTCVGIVAMWPRKVEQVDTSVFGITAEYLRGEVRSITETTCPGTAEADPGTTDSSNTDSSNTDNTGPWGPPLCLRMNLLVDNGDSYEIELIDVGALPRFSVGEELVLAHRPDAVDPYRYEFVDRERSLPMLLLGGLFVIAVLTMARIRGFAALSGMVVSLGAVAFLLLPALVSQRPPVPTALAVTSLIAFLAIYLAHSPSARVSVGVASGFVGIPVMLAVLNTTGVLPDGWLYHPVTAALGGVVMLGLLWLLVRDAAPLTTVALLGTIGALVCVVTLAAVFSWATTLSGLNSEEARYVRAFGTFDFRGLLLAGMVIGALGALDDMTVTQASAVAELRAANPTMSRRELVAGAMRIGRDHVASTVNTLVLAYAGAALPLLLLFAESGQPVWRVLTSEDVAVEVVRTLVGSIGLVVSVPLTTTLAAIVAPPIEPAANGDAFHRHTDEHTDEHTREHTGDDTDEHTDEQSQWDRFGPAR